MTEKDKECQEKSSHYYAAIGVGLICIIVGVPLWWKTTEVYRVQLPYGEISTLASTKIDYLVNLDVISFDETVDLAQLGNDVQLRLEANSSKLLVPKYRVSVRQANAEEKGFVDTAVLLSDVDRKLVSEYKPGCNSIVVVLLKSSSRLLTDKPYVGHSRITFFKNVQGRTGTAIASVVQEVIVKEQVVKRSLRAAKGARTLKPDKESMRSLRSTTGYDMTFTLVNPQPDILNAQWDIQAGVSAYLKPFLGKLEKFADFTINSQVLYFSGLMRRPQKNTVTGESFYTEQDLPHLITPLESNLGSHASNNPTLNFIVYVPTRDQSPLFVKDSSDKPVPSNSFFSPRWGGIWVSNAVVPEGASLPHRVDIDTRQMMEVFVTQLRVLLNLNTQTSDVDVAFAPLGNEAVTDYEMDAWLRSFCVENIATSAGTLQSLAQLLGEISNIVIKDDIGTEVEKAVAAIKKSLKQLSEGQLEDAFLSSKLALIASEKAFFDPSLLELLYFPEDQKFAIYIPLFLPISIPVITSLVQAVKFFRNRGKEKKE